MSEKIDLEPERQQEIATLEARMAAANLFEVLGVGFGASPDDIRTAFRELSRRYHPDRFFGKNLGEYRAKVDRIFKRLVEANQVLTDPDKRRAYLDANPALRTAVKAASGGFGAAPARPAPKTEDEQARDAERRARLTRHPYLAKASKMQELIQKGKEAVAKGDHSQAFQHLNMATQLDPQHAEARTLLIEVRRQYEAARSAADLKRAEDALAQGEEELALQALRAAVTSSPKNAKAAAMVATILERRPASAKEATAYAQKAVDGEPTNVTYRLLLARLLEEGGMKSLAKKQFEEAARLAPNHPEVKKQGKRFWPF